MPKPNQPTSGIHNNTHEKVGVAYHKDRKQGENSSPGKIWRKKSAKKHF